MVYRECLRILYNLALDAYTPIKTTNEGNRIARLIMYIVYCLTIDKLYIHEDIVDNFKYYFEWKREQCGDYVPVDGFQKYLEKADKLLLIKHSKYIILKYFSV